MIIFLLGYIDCATNDFGIGSYCEGCKTYPGKTCRVRPRQGDPQRGYLCGTCSSNGISACLHSPHYDSSNDQSPSKCDNGNVCLTYDS